jgi:ABC-type branched-subunit amino acid transport system permease subunit
MTSRLRMTIRELNTKVTTALHGPLSWEFNIMLGLAAILLSANLAYSSYMIGFRRGQAHLFDTFTVTGNGDFVVSIRIAITTGLIVCVVGLALRRLSGVFASMLGIIWLVLVYFWWKHKSVAFLRNAGIPDYSKFDLPAFPHAAGLWAATWWDLLALTIGTILFLWQAITVIRVIKASDHLRPLE